MGYFNYFIKQIIKIFTRKFFWVLLIGVLLFLGVTIFTTDVHAETILNYEYGSKIDRQVVNNFHYIVEYTKDNYGDFTDYVIFGAKGSDSNYQNIAYFCFAIVNPDGGAIFYTASNDFAGVKYNCGYCGDLHNGSVSPVFQSVSDVNAYYTFWNRTNYATSLETKDHLVVLYSSYESGLFASTHSLDLSNIPTYLEPAYIVNDFAVDSWLFDNLYISLGGYSIENATCTLDIDVNDVLYSIDLFQYYVPSERQFIIPRNQLSNNFVVRDNDVVKFYFHYRLPIEYGGTIYYDNLGTFTLSLNATDEENINQDSEKQVQGEMLEESKKTNEKLDNLNNSVDNLSNTITSDDVSIDVSSDLPSDSTNDVTRDGVNNIFTSIYNAFCEGQAQDIVLPIPYTNKNITISPNYLADMLNSINAGFITTIIQAFWWYLISRFIVKDVMDKINKIKSGNIEDIEQDNIKGDML